MTTEARAPLQFDLLDAAAAILVATQLAFAVHVALHGPQGPLPVHFGLHGQPDGWAGRGYVAGLLVAIAAITFGAHALVAWLRPQVGSKPGERLAFTVGRLIGLAVPAMVSALFVSIGFGDFADNQLWFLRLVFAVVWLSIAGLGAVIGKAPPNRYSGVRLYWTFHSRLAWDKANRLLGRVYFVGGLIGLVTVPLVDLGPRLVVAIGYVFAVTFGGAAAASHLAWRTWRDDPERTS